MTITSERGLSHLVKHFFWTFFSHLTPVSRLHVFLLHFYPNLRTSFLFSQSLFLFACKSYNWNWKFLKFRSLFKPLLQSSLETHEPFLLKLVSLRKKKQHWTSFLSCSKARDPFPAFAHHCSITPWFGNVFKSQVIVLPLCKCALRPCSQASGDSFVWRLLCLNVRRVVFCWNCARMSKSLFWWYLFPFLNLYLLRKALNKENELAKTFPKTCLSTNFWT